MSWTASARWRRVPDWRPQRMRWKHERCLAPRSAPLRSRVRNRARFRRPRLTRPALVLRAAVDRSQRAPRGTVAHARPKLALLRNAHSAGLRAAPGQVAARARSGGGELLDVVAAGAART